MAQKYDNPLVWAAFKRGDCLGIFQVETPLTTYWTKRLKPSNIEELSDVISLVRPGPLESEETEKYAKRKAYEEAVSYIHPALEPILKNTQGIVCYQESCSKIAGEIAGFPPAKQEALRKSLSKKKPEEIAKAKIDFIESAEKHGVVDKKTAEEIFAIIEKFQRYGFCKCLSENSLIETKNGLVELKDIKAGDFVKSLSDDDLEEVFTEVLEVIDTGDKELIEIELESGKTIQSTIDHKHVCEDGIKRPLWEIIQKNYKIVCQLD